MNNIILKRLFVFWILKEIAQGKINIVEGILNIAINQIKKYGRIYKY